RDEVEGDRLGVGGLVHLLQVLDAAELRRAGGGGQAAQLVGVREGDVDQAAQGLALGERDRRVEGGRGGEVAQGRRELVQGKGQARGGQVLEAEQGVEVLVGDRRWRGEQVGVDDHQLGLAARGEVVGPARGLRRRLDGDVEPERAGGGHDEQVRGRGVQQRVE